MFIGDHKICGRDLRIVRSVGVLSFHVGDINLLTSRHPTLTDLLNIPRTPSIVFFPPSNSIMMISRLAVHSVADKTKIGR